MRMLRVPLLQGSELLPQDQIFQEQIAASTRRRRANLDWPHLTDSEADPYIGARDKSDLFESRIVRPLIVGQSVIGIATIVQLETDVIPYNTGGDIPAGTVNVIAFSPAFI